MPYKHSLSLLNVDVENHKKWSLLLSKGFGDHDAESL
jgi:hypothetical protein